MKHSFAPFDTECETFLSSRLRINFSATDWSSPGWLCVSARDSGGQLMGVAAFEFKTAFDAHFSCAIADRRCLTRRLLKAMFTAVFSRAARVTALIEPWNDVAVRQARLLGFEAEGYMRSAIEGDRDALLFGMLRDDCRYLQSKSDLTLRKEAPDGLWTEAA